MSGGYYTQTDQGIVVQVGEVSRQQETTSTEGVQVPAEKQTNVVVTANHKLLTQSSEESSGFNTWLLLLSWMLRLVDSSPDRRPGLDGHSL